MYAPFDLISSRCSWQNDVGKVTRQTNCDGTLKCERKVFGGIWREGAGINRLFQRDRSGYYFWKKFEGDIFTP